MAQQYGLGRGLASLIPPKKKSEDEDTSPFHTPTKSDASGATGGFSVPHINPIVPASPPTSPNRGESLGGPLSVTGERRPAASDEPAETAILPRKSETGMLSIPIAKIIPNPHQPRLHFDPTKLDELTESIKEHGILQPLVVSRIGDQYELIAGERRFQAAKKIGLESVPVVVRDVTEQQKLELAIIENIQRHNLNPIEEAKSYLRLVDEFGLGQEAVAKKMGKSRSSIANTLRLLSLPVEIQRAVAEGKISEGHAKALLAIENSEKQRAVFDLIIKEELTVRETEVRVRSISVKPHLRSAAVLNPEIIQRAEHLTEVLGTKVKITPAGKGGKVIIEYYAPEDLDGLLKRLEE